jgi:hypothetical protein
MDGSSVIFQLNGVPISSPVIINSIYKLYIYANAIDAYSPPYTISNIRFYPTGKIGPTGGGGGGNTNIQFLNPYEGGTAVPFDWSQGPNGLLLGEGKEEEIVNSDFMVNVTNFPEAPGLYDLTLLIVQGPTGYYANSMEINGSNADLYSYLNDTPPTPQAGRIEIQSFKIFSQYGPPLIFTKLESYRGFPPPE